MKLRYHLFATLTLALTTLLCNAMNNEEPLITEKIDEKKNLFLDNLYKCNAIKDMVKDDLELLDKQNLGKQEFIKKSRKYTSKAFIALWEQYIDSLKEQNLLPENGEKLLDALTTIITITPENSTLVCDTVSLNKIGDYLDTLTFDQLLNLFPFCRFLDLDKKILKKAEEAFINKTVKQLSSSPTLPNKEALNHVLEDLCVENKARLLPEHVLFKVINHDAGVNSVAFNPDGTLVATALGNSAQLRNTKTGKLLFTLNHDRYVLNVAFNHKGTLVATASCDKTAKIWETKTGKLLFTLNHDDGVNSVAFNHDGTLVATASDDHTAKIWDTKTGKLLFTLNHDWYVNSVAFNHNGTLIATASYDKTAKIWSVETGKCLHILNHDNRIINVTFSPNGAVIATISGNTAKIWNTNTGKLIHTFNHDDLVGHIIFSPDGTLVATASNDKTAKIWETKTGKLLFILNHTGSIRQISFSPNGALVAIVSYDKTAKIWNTKTGKLLFTLNNNSSIRQITFSPNGTLVATTSQDDTVRVLSLKEDLTLAQYITVLFLNKLKKEGKELVFSELNPMIANIVRTLPLHIRRYYFPINLNTTLWTFFKTCGFVKK